MFQISIVLSVLSGVLFFALLLIWATPALSGISIRAPTLNDSQLVSYLQKRRMQRDKNLILSELSHAELFIARMLSSGVYTVHEIIDVAADMTYRLKPYFRRCYNRYFTCGVNAIEQMKQELSDDGFSVLCDTLKCAAAFDKHEMGRQISEHLKQLKELRAYKRQQVVNRKEAKFAFVMILPIMAFLIVQVYPWLAQAISQLSIVW